MRERICFQRSKWCTVSDSIHFSFSTSPLLHFKVVHCGLFRRVFLFFPVFAEKRLGIKPDADSVLTDGNEFLEGLNVSTDSPDLIV